MLCMLGTLEKQKNKTKDHSPSMTLSELPKQNDQVPQKLPENTLHYCIHGLYDDPRLSRLTF